MFMKNQILSLIGWRFLPNLATGWIQNIYYLLTIRTGSKKPVPGSVKYSQHRKRIFIGVISAYLLFTVYETDWEIRRKGHFFQVLKLPETATEREIKTRFRRLAVLHHPDKAATNQYFDEAYFVQLKLAQDILLEPVKRFAYERFGPAMLDWEWCSSMRDYLIQGLHFSLPSYIGAAFFMFISGFLGYIEVGSFWRWLAFLCLLVFDLHTTSSPHFPPILTSFLNPILRTFTNRPPYLPFQLIQLAHRLSIVFFIALSQIGPFFQTVKKKEFLDAEIQKQICYLEANVRAIDAEATRILNLEMTPFIPEKKNLDCMRTKVKDWLVQNTVRMDPVVNDAVTKTLKKRDSAAENWGKKPSYQSISRI